MTSYGSSPGQPAMLYGAGAIAAYLGMTDHACRHLIADGVLPVFRIGSRIAARRESIDAWLREEEARAQATRQVVFSSPTR